MSQHIKKELNARAVFNGEFYGINTYSGYRLLRSDPDERGHLLNNDCSDKELGNAIINALSASKVIPPDNKEFFDHSNMVNHHNLWVEKIMAQFNYKSKRSIFKKMLSCSISQLNGEITIMPSFHEKLEGWSGDNISESDYVVISVQNTPEEIGAALRLAFSRCKSKTF